MNTFELHFSGIYELASNEEVAWIRQQLASCEPVGGRAWERPEIDPNGFDWKIFNKPTGQRCLWLYSDTWGNPGAVGRFMQAFLQRFRPRESFGMAFTHSFDSASRLSPGSGGAIFVTADAIDEYDIREWLGDKFRAHQSVHGAVQAKG